MADKGPVGGIPEGSASDPYKNYRVDEILGDSKRGSKDSSLPEENKGLLSKLFKKLKQGLDLFFEKIGGAGSQALLEKKAALQLKESLDLLKEEDRSQDISFLNELAKHWNAILDAGLESDPKTKALFHLLIEKMATYPHGQTYTLGYYLEEHAGQDWIPFPYMELIQALHQEHELQGEKSSLTEWGRLLDDLIKMLDPLKAYK